MRRRVVIVSTLLLFLCSGIVYAEEPGQGPPPAKEPPAAAPGETPPAAKAGAQADKTPKPRKKRGQRKAKAFKKGAKGKRLAKGKKAKGKRSKRKARATAAKGGGKKGGSSAGRGSSDAAAVCGQLSAGKDNLLRENMMVNADGLTRFPKLADVQRAAKRGDLVPLRSVGRVGVDRTLGMHDRRHIGLYVRVRRWTRDWAERILTRVPLLPGERILFSSAVRTDWYHRRVQGETASAAPGTTPWNRSSHLTGATFDVTARGLSPQTQVALCRTLLEERRRGTVRPIWEKDSWHIYVRPPKHHNRLSVVRHKRSALKTR